MTNLNCFFSLDFLFWFYFVLCLFEYCFNFFFYFFPRVIPHLIFEFLRPTGPKFRELCLKDRITMFGALPNLQVPSLRHRTRVQTQTKFHKFTKKKQSAGRKTGDWLHLICTKVKENVIVIKIGRCLQTRSTSKNKPAVCRCYQTTVYESYHFPIFFFTLPLSHIF